MMFDLGPTVPRYRKAKISTASVRCESQAGFVGAARFKMEMSGTWEIRQGLETSGLEYADRMV